MATLFFGGSFNPIHHGHLICARAVAEARGFDRVVLIPSAQPPHKPATSDLASPSDRLAMCQLAVAGSALFSVSDLEVHRTGPSYTIDTIRQLQAQGSESIHWLIGADMLAILPHWRDAAALIQEATFVIMARPGWTFDWMGLPLPFRALQPQVVPAPLIDISATDIRSRAAAGQPIDYLTPPAVCQYIQQRRLYRKGGA